MCFALIVNGADQTLYGCDNIKIDSVSHHAPKMLNYNGSGFNLFGDIPVSYQKYRRGHKSKVFILLTEAFQFDPKTNGFLQLIIRCNAVPTLHLGDMTSLNRQVRQPVNLFHIYCFFFFSFLCSLCPTLILAVDMRLTETNLNEAHSCVWDLK